MKPRVIRMADAVNYICGYLSEKGVPMTEIADVADKLISFEVEDAPIDEEKLETLAISECAEILKGETFCHEAGGESVECVVLSDAEKCYETGYRKAKSE